MNFELTSNYKPTGDQPEAIAQLTEGVRRGIPAQTSAQGTLARLAGRRGGGFVRVSDHGD